MSMNHHLPILTTFTTLTTLSPRNNELQVTVFLGVEQLTTPKSQLTVLQGGWREVWLRRGKVGELNFVLSHTYIVHTHSHSPPHSSLSHHPPHPPHSSHSHITPHTPHTLTPPPTLLTHSHHPPTLLTHTPPPHSSHTHTTPTPLTSSPLQCWGDKEPLSCPQQALPPPPPPSFLRTAELQSIPSAGQTCRLSATPV